MSLFYPSIHATIRVQMLKDLNNNLPHYEVKARASKLLVDGCYVETELQASTMANHWFECLTYKDIPSNVLELLEEA